jgi:hypothetical protein
VTADDVLAWVRDHRYAEDDRHSIEDMAKFRLLAEEVRRLRLSVHDSRASTVARMRDEVAALEAENAMLRAQLGSRVEEQT